MEIFLTDLLGQYGLLALAAALGIGILTSLAPCSIVTLPLLVGSVLALSGEMAPLQKRRFTFYYSLLFVTGLVISFSLLMLLVAKAGVLLSIAPFWAYALASAATLLVLFYALGWLPAMPKDAVAKKLLRFKLFGAVAIGIIFGLVSTPCASAPLVAIITLAEQSGWTYSYALVLMFAVGHGMLLLIAGLSLGFAQSVATSAAVAGISRALNAFFMVLLGVIALYLAYEAYLVF